MLLQLYSELILKINIAILFFKEIIIFQLMPFLARPVAPKRSLLASLLAHNGPYSSLINLLIAIKQSFGAENIPHAGVQIVFSFALICIFCRCN